MLEKVKEKVVILSMLLVSVLLYIWVYFTWEKCPAVDCSEQLIDNWLRTIGLGSSYLIYFFIVALLLPVKYFKSWLKYIFSWGFPLVGYLTYITTGSSSIPAYGKVDVVQFWGLFFAIVSLILIIVQYYLQRHSKK